MYIYTCPLLDIGKTLINYNKLTFENLADKQQIHEKLYRSISCVHIALCTLIPHPSPLVKQSPPDLYYGEQPFHPSQHFGAAYAPLLLVVQE